MSTLQFAVRNLISKAAFPFIYIQVSSKNRNWEFLGLEILGKECNITKRAALSRFLLDKPFLLVLSTPEIVVSNLIFLSRDRTIANI